MNNNITSNQENNKSEPIASDMVWQTPVLYKEDWMNTLAGLVDSGEAVTPGNAS